MDERTQKLTKATVEAHMSGVVQEVEKLTGRKIGHARLLITMDGGRDYVEGGYDYEEGGFGLWAADLGGPWANENE